MKLVIVESPAKVKIIKSFLGSGYDVDSSVGHIRDLPTKSMGFDTESLKPEYEISPDKKQVVARLRKKAKAAELVILATDLDREGEAIAYHLLQTLKPKAYTRIVFNEITKNAVLSALQSPREIDLRMVAAQECRRLLDRYVGYTVSPWLSHSTQQRKMSAGRVQTVALLLLYYRYRAITDFVPQRYFELTTTHNGDKAPWSASLVVKDLIPPDQELNKITSEAQINHIQNFVMNERKLRVQSIEEERKRTRPPAPFKTSTLQQAASNSLKGFTPKVTMNVAQKLYEGGYITYMRTDVESISQEAQDSIRQWLSKYAEAKGIREPVFPETPHKFSASADAQEAHEGIRPSNVYDLGKNIVGSNAIETEKLKELYRLIWLRAVASQMPHYEYDRTTATLVSPNDPHNGRPYRFELTANKPAVLGWKMILAEDATEEKKTSSSSTLQEIPNIQEGDEIPIVTADIAEKQTKPPGYFKEHTLVKTLETEGVGRPSTFASIIETLLRRGFAVTNSKKQFNITDHGVLAIESLLGKFSFVDVNYTKDIESQLDRISKGQARYKEVLSLQIQQLDREIDANGGKPPARKPKEALPIVRRCPQCSSGGLVLRDGSRGVFLACNRYPRCKHSEEAETDRTQH